MTTLNGKTLTTHEATIQTAQVEIQVLKVGKKQVTMGLFRQLPVAPLVDVDSLALRGDPWGQVNYWWDGDGRDSYFGRGECRHIVWQDGPVLHRSLVYSLQPQWEAHDWEDEIQERYHRLYLRLLRAGLPGEDLPSIPGSRAVRVKIGGYILWVARDNERILPAEMWRDYVLDPPETQIERHAREWLKVSPGATELPDAVRSYQSRKLMEMRKWQEQGEALFATLQLDRFAPEDLWAEARESEASRAAYSAQWTQRYDALAALPQLFIAV
jgi:hypothetical protein